MPATFGSSISPTELEQLVEYLIESTSKSGSKIGQRVGAMRDPLLT